MILPIAASLAAGLFLLTVGGKKKNTKAPAVVEDADPDLVEAADGAQPGEVPVKLPDGDVVLVTPEPAPPELVELAPGEDPELDEAAENVEPGEIVTRTDDDEIVIVTPPEEDEEVEEVLPVPEPVELAPGEDPELDEDDDESREMPERSVKLLAELLAAERLKNWKDHHKQDVWNWQEEEGMGADGKFGPKSSLRLAEQTGVAAIVRYWPKGWYQGGKEFQNYLAQLEAMNVDSSREQGQGFGTPAKQITIYAEGF